ncbi:cysteine desulfurase NifS [Pseudodesulfovibrio sp.]|uniref:cysteine desulfurase NifS n=1 Tax=Pseudodesulfovibrio sp. TaxID=2035812 RepID=UPI002627F65B|nr:cysteine desulfurase NifS [Pseudodesulfovibrio sp.]MDD3312581.1 cysteine desulfurase NifS [Pseudodesulfovibrio sp.]
MQTIYLDNNATTRVDPAVFEAMAPFFTERYGNPSSAYEFGRQVAADIDRARRQTAALLGCEPDEIVFTSCGSESDNTAIRSALAAAPAKRHVIASRVEHPAVLKLCRHLAANEGYDVTLLGVDAKGRMDLEELRDALRGDTAVVSVMWANNETGNVHPIAEMAALAHERGAFFHTDAVQAVGKVPIDLSAVPVDMLALSGHKFHAPKGIGALFVRRGLPFRSLLIGGGQESGRRAGTENTAFIVGLGKACELAAAHMDEERTRVRELRDRLERGLLAAVPDTVVNGDPTSRLPGTSYLSFGSVSGGDILRELDRYGICASTGSACSAANPEPSHVLTAMDVPLRHAVGSVRFSLGRFNTAGEVDRVLAVLPGIIENLRVGHSGGIGHAINP